ncbi:saccharopine dehydrogenase NADP-binding domain-containing protein [Myxococcus sp. K15C18031901]|uniref:saccharopine dehydrogenase family protein n=1 Tax=Myxococcus dinghuensis TaxID=2906761 RepID=UPI0020A7E146|nr:saccharopine dehydrogenase NADP-binding domain-containing protein [Myxococcus dinghuensis]MCP3097873.1 saccharopine dehydrogenase NADP-binding domain-containing protein [Myxococcus dinghuensis]
MFGAYGHTGRFVVDELRRRGLTPILAGRDVAKLNLLGARHEGLEVRRASVDEPESLVRALAGARAVINCAGPFVRTAEPLIAAALSAHVHYVDVAAEVEVAATTLERYAARARDAGIVVLPSMAFYGGLGDLLATAAMGDWPAADALCLAIALSSWRPTLGTRVTGQVSRQRRNGQRLVFSEGTLKLSGDVAPMRQWNFPTPVGPQTVVGEYTTADSVTISHHLTIKALSTYLTAASLRDLADPDLPPPVAVDERGRSDQTFLVEVVARSGNQLRRAIARGQDIYAVSAPLAAEAVSRILSGPRRAGVFTAGQCFDASDFLTSLSPVHLSFETASIHLTEA